MPTSSVRPRHGSPRQHEALRVLDVCLGGVHEKKNKMQVPCLSQRRAACMPTPVFCGSGVYAYKRATFWSVAYLRDRAGNPLVLVVRFKDAWIGACDALLGISANLTTFECAGHTCHCVHCVQRATWSVVLSVGSTSPDAASESSHLVSGSCIRIPTRVVEAPFPEVAFHRRSSRGRRAATRTGCIDVTCL